MTAKSPAILVVADASGIPKRCSKRTKRRSRQLKNAFRSSQKCWSGFLSVLYGKQALGNVFGLIPPIEETLETIKICVEQNSRNNRLSNWSDSNGTLRQPHLYRALAGCSKNYLDNILSSSDKKTATIKANRCYFETGSQPVLDSLKFRKIPEINQYLSLTTILRLYLYIYNPEIPLYVFPW